MQQKSLKDMFIYQNKIRIMKKIVVSIVLISLGLISIAQQEAMFTHYSFNTLAVNPAYAGSRDALTITGLHRSQWVGFDGAPTTQTLTLHGPLLNNQIGLGLSILNDKIGPLNTTAVYADFAYSLKVNEKSRLAFGLKGGVNILQGKMTSLVVNDENDNSFANNIESGILPNFGFGMYYHTEKWYAGVSSPKLLKNKLKTTGTVVELGEEQRHLYVIGGLMLNLNKDQSLKFRPTTLIKVTEAAPIQADLTGMFVIQDKVELGAMFRTGDAVGLLLGYNFNPQFRIGYSFDWSFVNNTAKYNSGSHEVMLRYDLIYGDKERVKSPRYF